MALSPQNIKATQSLTEYLIKQGEMGSFGIRIDRKHLQPWHTIINAMAVKALPSQVFDMPVDVINQLVYVAII